MSDNYKLYARKVAELRAGRSGTDGSLRKQLDELFRFVQVCEVRWAREDWTERRF